MKLSIALDITCSLLNWLSVPRLLLIIHWLLLSIHGLLLNIHRLLLNIHGLLLNINGLSVTRLNDHLSCLVWNINNLRSLGSYVAELDEEYNYHTIGCTKGSILEGVKVVPYRGHITLN